MKTEQEIKTEIQSLTDSVDDHTPDRIVNRTSKRIRLLRELLIYIEQKPDEEIVKKHLSEAKRKLKIIDEGFGEWMKSMTQGELGKNPLTQYRGLMKRKTTADQIANLKYLLS